MAKVDCRINATKRQSNDINVVAIRARSVAIIGTAAVNSATDTSNMMDGTQSNNQSIIFLLMSRYSVELCRLEW